MKCSRITSNSFTGYLIGKYRNNTSMGYRRTNRITYIRLYMLSEKCNGEL